MSKFQDQKYLCEDQYKTANNLNARIRLHAEFSTNPYDWFRWVFDQYELPANAQILELGCGPADLWRKNIDRIPSGWDVTLSDFSPGMVAQARENLAKAPHPFRFEEIDAQNIPYPAGSFDAVIANHCIYHFPNKEQAFAEIRRVLKPAGRFYATTIGENHLKGLAELVTRFDPQIENLLKSENISFTLQSGTAQLMPWFNRVIMTAYPDELRVTDAAILTDYILSSMRMTIARQRRDELLAFLKEEMAAQQGVIHIQKEGGLFNAHNP